MKEIVKIEILGESHTFEAGSEVIDANAVVDLLVDEVDSVQEKIAGKSPNMTKLTILTLAALNIANEHIELKRKYSDLIRKISNRSKSLLSSIDTETKIL